MVNLPALHVRKDTLDETVKCKLLRNSVVEVMFYPVYLSNSDI